MRTDEAPRRLIFAGATTLDYIFRVDHMPTGPGKLLPIEMAEVAHGMAASAAAAAARLGGDCMLISRAGADLAGDRIVADLERDGVDCRFVKRFDEARSAICAVLVDSEGERLAVPYYDKALPTGAEWLPLDRVVEADAILVDVRWPQGAAAILRAARDAGVPAVLDADVAPKEVIGDLVELCSHAVFSEPAALALSGRETVTEAVEALAVRYDCFVAVTAGPLGCYWVEDGGVRHSKPPRVVAVDTLAAGDVFHGAFTLALAEGMPIADIIDFANAAAAIKCETFGGRLGAPDRRQVMTVLEKKVTS
ncbi:PfkB family carbohydrate kinase [Oricola indica]|jgi:sugar/nucleoside kinase (ribokinase family)|uniref:PfkB family carbohydrate kinase n=1 Tax=Oricola indica TaxID=2872591 RepID=UPI001CBDE7AE|nr:PfkB family carbohydrate kinase [Oricola indica]